MSAQEHKEKIKVYSFQEVENLHKNKPKPILIYIYTDWCKFCFGMNKNTFKNKDVIKKLNSEFYFIKLNAEAKEDITFLNKTFVFKPTGTNTGLHELANELANINNRISYPTTTILNSSFEIELQKEGYLNSKKMISLLKR